MNHLVFGSNSTAIADLGELIHSGQDGDAAEKAIADNREKFAVIRRTLPGFESFLRTVQQYDPNHPAVKAAADEAATADAETKAEEKAADAEGEKQAADPKVTPEPKKKRK
jgi:hypothetical protein